MAYKITAAVLTAVWLFAVNCFAADAVISGAQVTFSFKEPSTNVDGSKLQDLRDTSVFYSVNDGPQVKAGDVVASSKFGGGTQVYTFTVPIVDSTESTLKFWAISNDESGNPSPPSAAIIKRIDKLAPSSPE